MSKEGTRVTAADDVNDAATTGSNAGYPGHNSSSSAAARVSIACSCRKTYQGKLIQSNARRALRSVYLGAKGLARSVKNSDCC